MNWEALRAELIVRLFVDARQRHYLPDELVRYQKIERSEGTAAADEWLADANAELAVREAERLLAKLQLTVPSHVAQALPPVNGKPLCWESMIVVEHDGEKRALVSRRVSLEELCLLAERLSLEQAEELRRALGRAG